MARAWYANWPGPRAGRHAGYVLRRLETDVFPALGAKPIGDIMAPQLLAMAKKIEARGALDLARRAWQVCGQVFEFALAHGQIERNPSKDMRPGVAPKPRQQGCYARIDAKELPGAASKDLRLPRLGKLDAEEKERKAAAERERRARQQAELAAAMLRNGIRCLGVTQCDRTFAHAQAYVLRQADMRIQVATNTLIETYNGNGAGKVSMRIVRAPTAGDAWEVQMTAACNDGNSPDRYGDTCERALLIVYSGFLPHMQQVR